MDDSDVEFEEEWEDVQHATASAATVGSGGGDIYINLQAGNSEDAQGGKKRKVAGRSYTSKDREDALQVHRVHALCLLAHSMLHDHAASSSELQAMLLSMLPGDLLDAETAAATSEDPNAAQWLPNLLRWFHRTFTATAAPHIRQQQHGSTSSSSSRVPSWQREMMQDLGFGPGFVSVQQHLLGCVSDKRGSCEQLTALLVALLRGLGFLTRSVWSLEALPFRPAAVEALQRSKSTGSMKSRAASVPDQDDLDLAALAAAAAAATSKPGRKRSRTAAAGSTPAVANPAGEQVAAGGGKKRQRHSSNSKQQTQAGEAACSGKQAAAAAADEQQRKRKGDEEFEMQLAMAMASTAAEAESRAAAQMHGTVGADSTAKPHAASPSSNTASRPPSGLTTGKSLKLSPHNTEQNSLAALINRGASPAALKAAAQQAAAATPKGWLWAPNPTGVGAVPRAWAEVYIGSSADGRWLHVDALLGCFDQPGVVEAATARQQPLTYVVACQAGAPKDVTRRYAANFTMNMKWRDEVWWSSTMAALRSSAAHLPKQLAAQVAAAQSAALAVEQAAATADGVPAKQQQQRQEQVPQPHQQQQPPTKQRKQRHKQQTTAADGDAQTSSPLQPQHICAGSSQGRMQSGAFNAAAAAAVTAASADVSDAALRAAREDAELAARAARQAAGAPTTIEGFKSHPLYILERHITQKQGLIPGAAKLGLHKGEPYYSRKDVQDLHTRAHWRRQGRDVKESELPTPAKQAKKRAVPAAATSRSGQRGSGGSFTGSGGWGAWQRDKTAPTGKGTGPAARKGGRSNHADDEFDGELAPTAAAGAADGEGSNMQLLYGYWQTEEWEPPPAVDGKVPRNEHGNVEVPPFAKALPKGTKHIALPYVAPICRSLGIDFAPALVGFEVQAGRNFPKILGVVVCEEFEEAVMQLYLERQAEKAAAEAKKQQEEVEAAWRQLLGRMWTQLQLQRKYGTDASAGANAEAAYQHAAADVPESAREIIQRMHAAEQQQAGAAADGPAAASGQQAARARGGRVQPKPLLPPGMTGAAAVDGAVAGGSREHATADDEAKKEQQHDVDGVEVEEF